MSDRETDRKLMARCLELAAKYTGRTSPNPIVGSVIVDKRGKVIAEGAHAGPGKDHGERAALRKLKDRAPGATLYVNLEPCNHHGRTPPCAPLVRDSGVARVVIGALDPITGHGGGAALLKKAGIQVTTGVLQAECERANLPFFTWARSQRPAFTLKAAITLDGKIATVGGESKWITGDAARADVMRLRNEHDAVLVGVGTVLADDPRLTARMKGGRDPIRIVLDSQLRTPPTAALLPRAAARPAAGQRVVQKKGSDPFYARRAQKRGSDPIYAQRAKTGAGPVSPRTIIVATEGADRSRAAAIEAAGGEVWWVPPANATDERVRRPDLRVVADRLAASGVLSVLVEGGGETHASFLAAGLVDRIVLYIAPKIVGGAAKSWVGGPGVQHLADAYGFVPDEEISFIGGDLRLNLSRATVASPLPRS